MRIYTSGIATILCSIWAATAFGQTSSQSQGVDPQVRILAHKQVIEPGFGLAGWAIASDLTEKPETLPAAARTQRGLLVAGLGYKWESAWGINWAELMPGAFLIEGQKSDPVLDLRTSFALPKDFGLTVEGLWALRTERSMLITTLTVPVPGTKGRLRVGLGSDLIWKAGPDSLGAGPRLALKFSSHLNVALGYQFRAGNEPDFARAYVLITF